MLLLYKLLPICCPHNYNLHTNLLRFLATNQYDSTCSLISNIIIFIFTPDLLTLSIMKKVPNHVPDGPGGNCYHDLLTFAEPTISYIYSLLIVYCTLHLPRLIAPLRRA